MDHKLYIPWNLFNVEDMIRTC